MGWLLADRVVRQGVGLLILIWLARYLGPAEFGLFNYAVAYVALIWSFTDLGLSSIVVRNLVNQPSEASAIVGTTFSLRIVAVATSWLMAVTGIPFLRPGEQLTSVLVIVIATGMTFQITDAFAWWFEALVQSKYIVWARSAAFLLSSTLRALLILAHAPLVAFAYANAAELALAAIGITIAFYLRQSTPFRFRVSLQTARWLLRDSWPLIFSNLAIVLYMRLDQVMLGNMRGNTEVGIYSVVVLIAEAAYV